MKKIICALLTISVFGMCLAGCGNDTSSTDEGLAETATEIEEADTESVSNGELTSITLNDLKDYINLDNTIYIVQGTNVNNISAFSYDSDVIKSVSLDTSGVNTNAPLDSSWADFDADYVIVVDVNELCKKENKINGMTGDTAQVAGTIRISVVTQDFADDMVKYGARSADIIGYTASNSSN